MAEERLYSPAKEAERKRKGKGNVGSGIAAEKERRWGRCCLIGEEGKGRESGKKIVGLRQLEGWSAGRMKRERGRREMVRGGSLAGERAGAGCPVVLVGEEESKGRRDCGGAAAAHGGWRLQPHFREEMLFFFFLGFFSGNWGCTGEREGSPPIFGPNTLFIDEYHWQNSQSALILHAFSI